MTALERAHAIVAGFEERRELTAGPHTQWLVDAIHREIVEHGNDELERRRKVEVKVRELLACAPSGDDYRVMAISLSGRALSADMHAQIDRYQKALKALEGGDA